MKKTQEFPTLGQVLKAVGYVTFQEILKDRVLYNILICAFLLLGMSFLASRMSFIRPERLLLDFGLSAVLISCSMVGVLTGAGMLAKEFDRRTIYVALSHPITRAQFLLGKYAGLAAVIALNWFLLSAAYLGILVIMAGKVSVISGTLVLGLIFGLLQALILASVAIFFSTFTTTSLTVMISIGLYLVGCNLSQLKMLATRLKSPEASAVLNAVAAVLPNFEYFNLGTKVTYGLPVAASYIFLSIAYAGVVIAFLLIVAGFLIQGREV